MVMGVILATKGRMGSAIYMAVNGRLTNSIITTEIIVRDLIELITPICRIIEKRTYLLPYSTYM